MRGKTWTKLTKILIVGPFLLVMWFMVFHDMTETLDEAWVRKPPLPRDLTIQQLTEMERQLRPDHISNSPQKAFTSDNKVLPKYFKYRHNELSNICVRSQFMIFIYIHSSITNFDRRQLLRETWANPKTLQKDRIGLVFILGTAPNNSTKVTQKLHDEIQQYNDIVLIDYVDIYESLSVKASAALNWVAYNCAQFVPFILKADDDMFIDVKLLMEYVRNDAPKVIEQKRNEKLIFCHINFRDNVIRNPVSKWYISPTIYRKSHYPPFCPGAALLMTSLSVRHLRVSLNGSRVYPLDDVWFTAILTHNTGIQLVALNKYYHTAHTEHNFLALKWRFWFWWRRYMFVHCTRQNFITLWNSLNSG